MKQKLYSLLIYIILMFVGLGYTVNVQQRTYIEAGVRIQQNSAIIQDCKDILYHTVNMETGSRGYYLSQEPQFLDPYNYSKPEYERLISKLKSVLPQSKLNSLNQLSNYHNEWVNSTERNFSSIRNFPTLQQFEIHIRQTANYRKSLIDKQRVIINEIIRLQELETKESMRTIDKYNIQINNALFLTLIFSFGFSILLVGMIIRELDKYFKSNKKIATDLRYSQEKDNLRQQHNK